ncbi:NADPH2:quinone reductase [Catenulispora sp. GAS73]|uniref:quinone oxidoreductase family protein n=1 Tax=Catenulispora sp. GAS73 TaxID=3156269 RepID=UPI003511EDD0
METKQMEAVILKAAGSPDQALIHRDEPIPVPGPGEVLVEVHAAAVNPLDVANAAGWLGTPLPMIPGVDFAGVVVSGGEHEGWEAGQEVWGSGPNLGMKRPGTHARFVALPATWLSRKPANLTMAEAAAVGRSHLTAFETLINLMEVKSGEKLLITGGSGMVARAATAIARWRGAEPIIAARHRPEGVEHFIDTSAADGAVDLADAVLDSTDGRGADLALDTVGGALFEPALRSLRFGGRMVGIFSAPEPKISFSPAEIYNRQLRVTGLASVFLDGAYVAGVFDQLRPLFEREVLVAPAVRTWALAEGAEAYRAVMSGSGGVKQVLVPSGG